VFSGQQKEIEMTDVVIWIGETDIDEGPMVDEFERCVWSGMPDGPTVVRMAWMLDMPSRRLAIHRSDRLAALVVSG